MRRWGLALMLTAAPGAVAAQDAGLAVGTRAPAVTVKDLDGKPVDLAAYIGKQPLFLDVPEPNRAAVALAERHGMTPVFETARMYRGPAPAEPVERMFGVTSFELG